MTMSPWIMEQKCVKVTGSTNIFMAFSADVITTVEHMKNHFDFKIIQNIHQSLNLILFNWVALIPFLQQTTKINASWLYYCWSFLRNFCSTCKDWCSKEGFKMDFRRSIAIETKSKIQIIQILKVHPQSQDINPEHQTITFCAFQKWQSLKLNLQN